MIDNYQGKKFFESRETLVDDNLAVEQALQIKINNNSFTITMRTPGDDESLIRGLLFSEDIYKSDESLKFEISENKERGITEANVIIKEAFLGSGYSNSRSMLSVSSCGICGKKELEDLSKQKKMDSMEQLSIHNLYKMFEVMSKGQPTFHLSGGSHAAAAFASDGSLLCIMEDIGRHNAVDKVIGYLKNTNQLKLAKCIVVSGRISYEIVTKIFAAKIPVLAAVSAPSTLAVDFAKELGVTLLGFCREEKATCYAHPYRILSD